MVASFILLCLLLVGVGTEQAGVGNTIKYNHTLVRTIYVVAHRYITTSNWFYIHIRKRCVYSVYCVHSLPRERWLTWWSILRYWLTDHWQTLERELYRGLLDCWSTQHPPEMNFKCFTNVNKHCSHPWSGSEFQIMHSLQQMSDR